LSATLVFDHASLVFAQPQPDPRRQEPPSPEVAPAPPVPELPPPAAPPWLPACPDESRGTSGPTSEREIVPELEQAASALKPSNRTPTTSVLLAPIDLDMLSQHRHG
jgi:hypothetical protein